MNPHLSSREISEYLAGSARPEKVLHARECLACREDLEHLQASLARFRGTIRNWSDAVSRGEVPVRAAAYEPLLGSEIWGLYRGQKKAWCLSLGAQTVGVALLFTAATNQSVQRAARQTILLYDPAEIAEYRPQQKTMQGGGGGGDRSPIPASKGRLPKASLKQFTPPMAVPNNLNPRLTMDPSIVAPPDLPLPQVAMSNYGDPLAKVGPLSNGPGSGGGIGSGSGGGVGAGSGPGVGAGSGGGMGGGVFRIGGGVSAPILVYKVEPEYSDEARKAKYQGTVILVAIVDAKGQPVDLRVIRSLGMGLDERAIEAVRKWRFRPGHKDGKPVAVIAQIEVSFRLL